MSFLALHCLTTCGLLLTASVISLAAPNASPQDPQNGSLALAKSASLVLQASNSSARAGGSGAKDLLLLNTDTVKMSSDPKIECDDFIFGHPPAASCRDALNQLHVDPSVMITDPIYTYGLRGRGDWDVNLPKRYISSDGLCTLDLTQNSTPSHVKYFDLLSAARIMQLQCVEMVTSTYAGGGGVAMNMGEEKNFQVTIQAADYPPWVRCSNYLPPAARPVSLACQTIINTMNAATAETTFGARGVKDVQQYLPMVLTEPTNTCAISIDITAPDDKVSWYDLWQTAVALDGMCARAGTTGKSRFLGANRRIVMEIKRS